MKQSLQLRLGQQITMTPQLQQAIRLLQLSTLDLQVEIQQVLESNIMLEIAEEDVNTGTEEAQHSGLDEDGLLNASQEKIGEELISPSYNEPNEEDDNTAIHSFTDIPEELAVDSQWKDIYDSMYMPYDYVNNDIDGKEKDFNNNGATQETLRDRLLWQLDLTPFTQVDHAIAVALIDAINSDGYLTVPIEEITQSLGENIQVDIEEIETVLHRIQRFDPVGVGARNLSECLLLQLGELDANTPWLGEASYLVSKYLALLATHDYAQLVKCTRLSRAELKETVKLIQSLNPRPGAQLENYNIPYVVPDIFVKKVQDQWRVELNSEILPRLRINHYYAGFISQAINPTDLASLKGHLQEARWFIKSLKSRHETLLKVAKCIVEKQNAFFDYGEEAMKPLVLHDIATELEMHESTVSRVTTQKYIHTPRGIFELKYFFSSHVSTDNGGKCSSTAIRALIKKLIATENTVKPLSDSKIAKLLSEQGIKVARRTVAKYREAMVIPPSNERKRLV